MIVQSQRADGYEMMRYLIDAGAPQDWEYDEQYVSTRYSVAHILLRVG